MKIAAAVQMALPVAAPEVRVGHHKGCFQRPGSNLHLLRRVLAVNTTADIVPFALVSRNQGRQLPDRVVGAGQLDVGCRRPFDPHGRETERIVVSEGVEHSGRQVCSAGIPASRE